MIPTQRDSNDVAADASDGRPLGAPLRDLVASEERYRTLFETLPMGIVLYDCAGSIIGANPAASEILGLDLTAATSWPIAPQRQVLREDGSPCPRGELPVFVALRKGQVVADTTLGVPHRKSGELRWVRVTAVPDARDEQGHPSRVYAIVVDLTEQRRTEAALRHGTALLGRLRDANLLGVVDMDEHQVHEANDAYLDIIGYNREDLEAGRIAWPKITPPDWVPAQRKALEQLRQTGSYPPYEKEYVHKDGHRVPVLIGGAVLSRGPLRWVSFAVDLSARQRAERERAALLARARVNRSEADSARERLAFLMRASALVAASRDRDELLDQVARLVVPSLADYCVVYLPTTDGMLVANSIAHRNHARAKLLSALRDHPISPAGPMIAQRAYTAGTTQLSRDLSAELPAWISAEPEAMSVVRLMRPRSAIATPLQGPDGPLGVVSLARGARRRRFTEADVQVMEELGRRLAVGLVNTDTFAREHAIAETLQRALLPDTLPQVPGLDLAVRYLPATEGADVGGDWYDAFPLDGGRVGLVTGDVAGHSIASASVMGQVRSLLRGYAIDDPDPGRVLERSNIAVARLLPDALASVVYAVLDPATGDLCYSNAGHPPLLVAAGRGHAEYLDDTTGTMLGAISDARFTTGHRILEPGARLLLYTDGLIEDRRRDITDGLADLAATLRNSRPRTAGQTCAMVPAVLLGTGQRHDDVCLLTARLTG
jgi:PAS domain S-box-containing protein